MGRLQRFEQRLEQGISHAFARAFRSEVQPVEISAALQKEVDSNVQIVSRTRRMVPNVFHVELSASDHDRLAPYGLESTVAEELDVHAHQQAYTFPGPIRITFAAAEDLTTGRFRVTSEAQAKVTGHATQTQVGRARALLVVNGTRHPLAPPGLVVGRGSEADLRVNDPGISRRHAQFVVDTDGPGARRLRIEVRDLGSTNGITVDGHRRHPRLAARRLARAGRQHHHDRLARRGAGRCLS